MPAILLQASPSCFVVFSSIAETAALIVEIVLTFVLVFTVLAATDRIANAAFAGIPIGLVLTLIHLVGIPVTNTSVNPARSTGMALFAGSGAVGQLWMFWVAPIIGALLGGFLGGLLEMTPPDIDAPAAGEMWELLKTGRKFRGLGRKDGFRILRMIARLLHHERPLALYGVLSAAVFLLAAISDWYSFFGQTDIPNLLEYGFGGGEPKPWLKSVKDPYDDVSPRHKWGPFRYTLRRAQGDWAGATGDLDRAALLAPQEMAPADVMRELTDALREVGKSDATRSPE